MRCKAVLIIFCLQILILFTYSQVRYPVIETHNEGFDPSVNQLNRLFKAPYFSGQGITVSVKEQKVDSNDIDLRSRYQFSPLSSNFITTHATQMATLIAGAGNTSDFSRGSAWKASISSSSFFNLMPDPPEYFTESRISIQNHSYGVGIESYYGQDAASYDSLVNLYPYLLHVFSAGNLGDQETPSGKYSGLLYSNLSGSFKMSKNTLSVGAVDAMLNVATKSSRGPANDGRIKPELVAYGLDGTSGAAAIVSGVAAVIQQVFRDQEGSLPPASMVRAILMNTAEDIGMPGPDHESGYGNLRAMDALNLVSSRQYRLLKLKASENKVIELPPQVPGKELKVMISWVDPPASPNTTKGLLYDFDLSLLDPQNNLFKPWILSSYPNKDSLIRRSFRGTDTLNTQEQVTVTTISGTYRVQVKAPRGFTGEREIALCWFTSPDSIGWSFPIEGDKLKSGTSNIIQFTSPLPSTGQLEVQHNNQWTKLADLPVGTTRYNWNTPPASGVFSLKVILKDTILYSSPFSVSNTPVLKVGFVCPDSTFLYWNTSAGGPSRIFKLEEMYLDTLGVQSDSSLLVKSSGTYYGIAERFEGIDGFRSLTLLPSRQGVGCYVNSLLVDLDTDNSARINLVLGTLNGVNRILLQKLVKDQWVSLDSTITNFTSSINWTDNRLVTGKNYYRVLVYAGSRIVYSNIESVFYFGKNQLVLYPNPVNRGQGLKIATKDTENLLVEFFDPMGRKLYSYGPFETIEQVPTGPLRGGVYFYRITRNNRKIGAGRLVVQ